MRFCISLSTRATHEKRGARMLETEEVSIALPSPVLFPPPEDSPLAARDCSYINSSLTQVALPTRF